MTISKLSEPDLINFLFHEYQLYSNAFYFMESVALGHSKAGWQLEIHTCVARQDLELELNRKPGDIDVLMIPVFDGDRFAERAMAIEVKRFFVPANKRGRGPNEYGIGQVQGLVEDGFPFVGLVHVPLIQQSAWEDWVDLPFVEGANYDDPSKSNKSVPFDLESYSVMQRHFGRFRNFELPDRAGFNSFSISLSESQDEVAGWSVSNWKRPQKNTQVNPKLVECLRRFSRKPDFVVFHDIGKLEIRANWKG